MLTSALFGTLIAIASSSLPKGLVIGPDASGRSFSARLGVRYAPQPVRFQKATMATNWRESTMDQRPQECEQMDFYKKHNMSEDCLFMNIYGPTDPEALPEKLPVLVYIHGGAYKFGTSNEFKPKDMTNLAMAGFVVVAFQYRLSALGFLALNGTSTPNLGLHDSHLALEFIHKNIGFFGGNAQNVTLIGQSAGACTAHALAISPATNHALFKRVVLMSAVVDVCFEGTFGGPSNTVPAMDTWKSGVCAPATTDAELKECLMKAPASEIIGADMYLYKNWQLVVDGYFFPRHPAQMERSSRGHDILIGVTTDEWAFFREAKDMDLMVDFYLDGKKDDNSSMHWYERTVQALTDLIFHLPTVTEVSRILAADKPPAIQIYTFDVRNPIKSGNDNFHSQHGDELHYLFGNQTQVLPQFRDVVLGFAKEGKFPAETTHRHHLRGSLVIKGELPYTAYQPHFCPRAEKLKKILLRRQRIPTSVFDNLI
ncbi:unnamed protein product, partial [Mesorhabditis spiculigera]